MARPINFDARRPPPTALAACATASMLMGCTSIDPGPDTDRSAAIVADRTRISAAWRKPIQTSLTGWDGRAPLTLEAALRISLRNNREIRAAVESIAASRADLVQAGLLPNPVVALTLRFPFDPVSGGSFVGASLVQSFTALWLRDGRIRAADARLNQTVLDVSDKALRLVAEVKATHARIVFGQRAAALGDESCASIQRSIDAFEARIRGGEGTPLDTGRARQQLAGAQAAATMTARDLAKDRRRLLELMGFPGEWAEWSADPADVPPWSTTLDEPAAMQLAAGNRLDVAAARAVVEAQRADLGVEELSRLKDLGIGADFERETDGRKTIGPVIGASIPIFDINEAQIAKAGSLARAALLNYEALAQRATREVRVAWIDLDVAVRLADQYRSGVLPLADRNLSLATASLNSGQADVTVLLEAQRELIEARRALNDLEREAALARVALEQAAGGTLEQAAPAAALK